MKKNERIKNRTELQIIQKILFINEENKKRKQGFINNGGKGIAGCWTPYSSFVKIYGKKDIDSLISRNLISLHGDIFSLVSNMSYQDMIEEFNRRENFKQSLFVKWCNPIAIIALAFTVYNKCENKKIKEGILRSHIEVMNKQEHNSIGDKNENNTQQAKDNPKAEQTDSKNVLSEKRDEGDRTANPTDRTSNTQSNTREKMEQTTRAILLYSLSYIPFQSDSIEFNIRTNRSELLWALPYTKEVSYSESKEKSVE